MTTLLNLLRSAARFERQIRSISGGQYRRGTSLVHIKCGACGYRVATVEHSPSQGIVTLWRGRRFPGVPYVECSSHGTLELTPGVLKEKVDLSRESGKPQTLRAAPRV